MYTVFWLILRSEVLEIFRHWGELFNPWLFFVLVVSLFPLGVSPDPQVLQSIAPGILWVVVLLSILLSLERLFRADFFDGTLEQLLLSHQPLFLLVFAKLFAHWLVSALPLVVIAPVLAMTLHLPNAVFFTLVVSLLLGTPTLIFLGSIGRALTVGLRNSGLLVILLVLPFYIPVLIFGASAVSFAAQGLSATGQLAWLGVFLIFSLSLAPVATVAALRIGVT